MVKIGVYNDGKGNYQSWETHLLRENLSQEDIDIYNGYFQYGLDIAGYGSTQKESYNSFICSSLKAIEKIQHHLDKIKESIENNSFEVISVDYSSKEYN